MARLAASMLAALLVTICVSAAAGTEQLSYRGWRGSADFEGSQFIGCHLDSPPSLSDPYDPIRVVAKSPLQFFIQYSAEFDNPQPSPGATSIVHLSLVNGDKLLTSDWGNDEGYRIRVLSNGMRPDGKPFTRELLEVNADDEIMSHLKDARYLKVYYKRSGLLPLPNFWILDLRHRSLTEPKSWASALDPNDTYGAIKEAVACASRYSGPTDPMVQARLDFETALRVMIDERSYDRSGMLNDLIDDGLFYCKMKQQMPYDIGKDYAGNVSEAIQRADILWVRQHFSNPDEAQSSSQMAVDEISMRDSAMAIADRHLCPGWPAYPRPEH